MSTCQTQHWLQRRDFICGDTCWRSFGAMLHLKNSTCDCTPRKLETVMPRPYACGQCTLCLPSDNLLHSHRNRLHTSRVDQRGQSVPDVRHEPQERANIASQLTLPARLCDTGRTGCWTVICTEPEPRGKLTNTEVERLDETDRAQITSGQYGAVTTSASKLFAHVRF